MGFVKPGNGDLRWRCIRGGQFQRGLGPSHLGHRDGGRFRVHNWKVWIVWEIKLEVVNLGWTVTHSTFQLER